MIKLQMELQEQNRSAWGGLVTKFREGFLEGVTHELCLHICIRNCLGEKVEGNKRDSWESKVSRGKEQEAS